MIVSKKLLRLSGQVWFVIFRFYKIKMQNKEEPTLEKEPEPDSKAKGYELLELKSSL